jgi:hypothetical protein
MQHPEQTFDAAGVLGCSLQDLLEKQGCNPTGINMNTLEDLAISQKLTQRFYKLKTQGTQTYYWDSVTGGEVQAMHLIGVVMQLGGQSTERVKRIVSMANFKPLWKQPIYLPNKPVVVLFHGLYRPNLWRRPDITANPEGNADRFFEHLKDVLGCDDKTNYLLDVLAWRYQHPSEPKPHIALYLFGEQGGAGKSTFAETLTHVFGRESVKTVNTTKELTSKGSVDYWSRTWLVVEEAQVAQGTALYDNIKSFTGTDEIDADKKYENVSKHQIPAQLIMLSNRPPAFIENNDRRFFVCRWHLDLDTPEDRQQYFTSYRRWLESGGYEAIAGHLATREVSADLYQAAPMTPEKVQALAFQTDPVVEDIQEFLEAHAASGLFTTDNFNDIWRKYSVKSTQRKHKMAEAGLLSYGRTLIDGKQPTVWYRNTDKVYPPVGKYGLYVELVSGQTVKADDALCRFRGAFH